jgi:4'-phosphopantetheinyl transferase
MGCATETETEELHMDSLAVKFINDTCASKDDRNTGVHVWLVRVDSEKAPAPESWPLLDAAERETAERFYFKRDWNLYVKSHVWLRRLLGQFTDQEPQDVRFHREPNAKPVMLASLGTAVPFFNLSHTDGYLAIAISMTDDVGIDVEKIRTIRDAGNLMQTILHPAEQAELAAMSPQQREHWFYRLWTAKEAYTKAIGKGLSHRFDRIAVDVRPGGSCRLKNYEIDQKGVSMYSMLLSGDIVSTGFSHAFSIAVLAERASLFIRMYEDPKAIVS